MTITIANRFPAPWSSNVSPSVRPKFSLDSDAGPISSVDVYVNGELRPGTLDPAGVAGFDVVVDPRLPFPPLDQITVRVVADAFDESWSFTIADVQGPGLAEAAPPPGAIALVTPTAMTARLTSVPTGVVDMFVDGVQIIEDDVVVGAGWVGTVSGADIDLTTVPALTDRVRVAIHADASEIGYVFDVGDTRGPQITNVTPSESSKGLVAVDVEFDITDSSGAVAGLVVEVNGTPVTPTTAPITNGLHVTLAFAAFPVDQTSFVDVTATGAERRVLRFHFGEMKGTQTVSHGLGGTFVRVLGFDFSNTSFGDPERLGHTGFAHDGYEYAAGALTGAQALWSALPLSGEIVITTAGWEIVGWGACTSLGSGWNMAGLNTLVDVDFHEGRLLIISDVAVLVDFVQDLAYLFDSSGRTTGTKTIDLRQDAQTSADLDTDYVFPAGPYARCTIGDSGLAVASMGAVTFVTSSRTLTRTKAEWSTAAWVRLKAVGDQLFMAYNDSGQGQVEQWPWAADAATLFLDDATTPALAVGEIKDLDADSEYLAAAMNTELSLVDLAALTTAGYSQAALTLPGVLVAVAMEGLVAYVAGGTRLVRLNTLVDDIVTMKDGVAYTSLVAVGATRHNVDAYVRTSMAVIEQSASRFVNTSLEVA